MTGFNDDNERERMFYGDWIGKPGLYTVGATGVYGVLEKYDVSQGFISIKPSIVGIGDSKIRMEYNEPTEITLVSGNPVCRRPMSMEDLETILDERKLEIENRKSNSKKNKPKK